MGEGEKSMPQNTRNIQGLPIIQGLLHDTGFESYYSHNEYCIRDVERHEIKVLVELIFTFGESDSD